MSPRPDMKAGVIRLNEEVRAISEPAYGLTRPPLSIAVPVGAENPVGHIRLYRQPILAAAERAGRAMARDAGRASAVWHKTTLGVCCFAMVLRHELIHAACHLGRFHGGGRWPYEAMPTGVHELLAEFFKDKPWRDPLPVTLQPRPEAMQRWLDWWHAQQGMLSASNPYRQHLPLRALRPEPVREVAKRLVVPYRTEAKSMEISDVAGGLDEGLLAGFLDSTASPLPPEGVSAGHIRLGQTGLLELLGFARAALEDGLLGGVEVRLYEQKPDNVEVPVHANEVPLNVESLEALFIGSAELDERARADVNRLWSAVSDRDDGLPLEVFQSRPWDLRMLQEMHRWFAAATDVGEGEFSSMVIDIKTRRPCDHFLWEETLIQMRAGESVERRLAHCLDDLAALLERVRSLLRSGRIGEVTGQAEALGAYVKSSGVTLIHPIYLPFPRDVVLKYFGHSGTGASSDGVVADSALQASEEAEKNVRKFEESAARRFAFDDSAADGAPLATLARAYQIEKDETFWTAATWIRVFESPRRAELLEKLLRQAFDGRDPMPLDGELADWRRCLEGRLRLRLEAVHPSPARYKKWLGEEIENGGEFRHLVPHVARVAKGKTHLEGGTHVDALIVNESNGFAVAIEAKVLSDISPYVTYDMRRNQIARNLDVMMDDARTHGARYEGLEPMFLARRSDRTLFLLQTPRVFQRPGRSRLYWYKYHDYIASDGAIQADLPHRTADECAGWGRRIGWLTWEDCREIDGTICQWLT
ncbi:MAG: hypothetical protein SF028_11330 [Candidatus Sumerlaeia bacterium]|nr:hypothetical protein [Candidatus Sumerlaeia bacterium]